MALKHSNKRKRKGYWKRYFKARIKDFLKVWDFLDEILAELGVPFEHPIRGRPPNLSYEEITKMCIFMAYFDMKIDEMVGLLPLLTRKILNRSNVDRWFIRFDDEYARKATKLLDKRIQSMFRGGSYIADATKYTTDRYAEEFYRGETQLELLCMGLHIIVTYFLSVGIVSITNFKVTHGDAHESPVCQEELKEIKLKKNRRFYGDKAYDVEEIHEQIFEAGALSNICEKEIAEKGFYRHKARKIYNDKLRKKIRGIVETPFGGMETETGNKIRFRLDRTRKTYLSLRALTHQIRTYFRAVAHKATALFTYFRNNLVLWGFIQ